jgi:peroxiredoxin family protein
MDEPRVTAGDHEVKEEILRRVKSTNNPPPSVMLSMARETGLVRLLACSASMQYLGLGLEETARVVDEVVGMPTILRVALEGVETIYI